MSIADLIRAISEIDADKLPALMLAIAARMAEAKSTPAAEGGDELLDAREAARCLGVSASTLYHTDFPFMVKVGGSRRYSRNGIQKYIERRQRKI
jgi:predicted DNA-binding transcriptional regulator AlpA